MNASTHVTGVIRLDLFGVPGPAPTEETVAGALGLKPGRDDDGSTLPPSGMGGGIDWRLIDGVDHGGYDRHIIITGDLDDDDAPTRLLDWLRAHVRPEALRRSTGAWVRDAVIHVTAGDGRAWVLVNDGTDEWTVIDEPGTGHTRNDTHLS